MKVEKAKKKILPKNKPTPRPVPYTALAGIPVTEPILEEEICNKAIEAITPFTCRIRWEKWGLAAIRKQGGALLLTGEPGTGKTTLARWLAKKVSNGIIEITMADVGGGDPGDTERNTREIFELGRKFDNCAIHIDECDSILWSRDKAGPDSMWMLAVVNEFLMQIERYPGLVILSTNMDHFLDPALARRIVAKIRLNPPPSETRERLWKAKMPVNFPLKLKERDLQRLARVRLTGALIENSIIQEAQAALREGRMPNVESLCNIAKTWELK